jgi:hypothetical protein
MKIIDEIGHFSDIPLDVLVELDRKVMTGLPGRTLTSLSAALYWLLAKL